MEYKKTADYDRRTWVVKRRQAEPVCARRIEQTDEERSLVGCNENMWTMNRDCGF